MIAHNISSMGFRGEDNGVKTVKSLRGRLLAERVASKAAKTEADLMAKRLEELEKKLAEELKTKSRAEKRLEYALKKLKSLKLSNLSESSQSSSDGWKTNFSAALDSPGSCGSKVVETEETTSGIGSKNVIKVDEFGSSSVDSVHLTVSQEGSWSSVGTAHSRNKEEHQEFIADGARKSCLDADEPNSPRLDKHSDDTLALVPVENSAPSSKACGQDFNNRNVQEVLLALRHVKNQLRSSMGKKSCCTFISQTV